MSPDLTVKKKSLAEEVSARLQKEIQSGEFQVGAKLPTEPELMKMFGVGRSTIREAIRVLSNSGLLNVQQGLGTFVKSQYATNEPISQRLKRADSCDLDEVRQILEMKIAEKAAQKRTKRDLVNIRARLEEIESADAADDLEKCIDADINFHAAIAEASHNAVLLEFYELASEHLRKWYRKIYSDVSIFRSALDLHKALYTHIESADAKQAWNVAEKIIEHGRV